MDLWRYAEMSEYTFFWNGPFSQWYPSPFKDHDGNQFTCAEQYMMYRKAKLFGDEESAKKIMATNYPKEQKALGRLVKGFDPLLWDSQCMQIVKSGNYFKFTQNPKLLEALMSTGDTMLVEASPYDRIWGIGFDEEHALENKNRWGKNLLGQCLVAVRNKIRSKN